MNMIVLCPGCHTRYRHAPPVDKPDVRAQCSQCDDEFPLRPARRTYVLLPPAGRRPIGMDDPLLADQIRGGAPIAPSADGTPRRHSVALEALIAMVPTAIGAGMAYHFAGQQQVDPVTWSALGGAIGLLLGWGCLLWMGRKD